jgi:arsenite-transporting ATPase
VLLELAQQRRVLFFGGKGGVGKTTVSAATALAMARAGRKVLLVSTDPAHNLGHLFDRKLGDKPVKVTAGLDVLELDPEATVARHMKDVTQSLHQLMPVQMHKEIDKHIKLSEDAPGMQEAALLEKMADVLLEGQHDCSDGEDGHHHHHPQYDLIVFDTAPSGHTARLMVLPEMMSAWTEGLIKRREKADRFAEFVREMGSDNSMEDKFFGGKASPEQQEKEKESKIRQILLRRRRKFSLMRDMLADQERTAFVIVLAAERLPVLETIELQDKLKAAKVNVAGLVINKRSPADAGDFLAQRREQEEVYLAQLGAALPRIPKFEIPLSASDIVGVDALEQFAEGLV